MQGADADLSVRLEPARGRARDHAQLERRARGPGADHHRLVVDRDQALAAAHLLGGDVGEQIAPHRALVVGREALALARDQHRHEVERVELSVGVLEAGAGAAALVDDQLHAGMALGVLAHPRPPGPHRGGQLALVEAGQRGSVPGRADDHLVRPARRRRREQVGLAGPRGGAQRVGGRVGGARGSRLGFATPAGERRVEVGDRAGEPARPVRVATAGPVGPDLRRGLRLVALAEGAVAVIEGVAGRRLQVDGAVGSPGGEQGAQPGQLVDAGLRMGRVRAHCSRPRGLLMRTCSMPASRNSSPSGS